MIQAYLDPASGSMIMGAVAAGGAGVVVAGKTMMAKMRFRKRPVVDIDLDDAAETTD
ncbi:MAG: hypothetical protein ACI9C1_003250 [Candidatus Aldehydirespiratoraceae bacterium]|jgi:hypothetical protein